MKNMHDMKFNNHQEMNKFFARAEMEKFAKVVFDASDGVNDVLIAPNVNRHADILAICEDRKVTVKASLLLTAKTQILPMLCTELMFRFHNMSFASPCIDFYNKKISFEYSFLTHSLNPEDYELIAEDFHTAFLAITLPLQGYAEHIMDYAYGSLEFEDKKNYEKLLLANMDALNGCYHKDFTWSPSTKDKRLAKYLGYMDDAFELDYSKTENSDAVNPTEEKATDKDSEVEAAAFEAAKEVKENLNLNSKLLLKLLGEIEDEIEDIEDEIEDDE